MACLRPYHFTLDFPLITPNCQLITHNSMHFYKYTFQSLLFCNLSMNLTPFFCFKFFVEFQSLLFWNLSMNLRISRHCCYSLLVSILIVLEFINEQITYRNGLHIHTEFQSLLFWNLSMNTNTWKKATISSWVSILIVLEFINELKCFTRVKTSFSCFNPYCFGIYQ